MSELKLLIHDIIIELLVTHEKSLDLHEIIKYILMIYNISVNYYDFQDKINCNHENGIHIREVRLLVKSKCLKIVLFEEDNVSKKYDIHGEKIIRICKKTNNSK